jgi:hypothetical protein
MNESLFEACLPWAICLIAAVVAARCLVWLSGARLRLVRLRSVHRCELGSVQSLSFVLTLPFFVMIIMLIVQASHIMIANIVVHYAAFASARSAVVWIPANVNLDETANRISAFAEIQTTSEGTQYRVYPAGPKFSKIQQAAALACLSLGPSRDLGYPLPPQYGPTQMSLINLYRGLDAESVNNSLISTRLTNKLAYTVANTNVDVTFWHRYGPHERFRDPPLQVRYGVRPYIDEYYPNEVGWQDHITATVTYNLPLLPGPVRLFAPATRTQDGSSRVDQSGNVYIWPISASSTLGNEGEKPLKVYWQEEF